MQVDYVKESECQTVGLFLYPADMAAELVSHREFLSWKPHKFSDIRAYELESLVQFKILGDSVNGFSQGITMNNSDTLSSLRFTKQEEIQQGDETEVITYLISARGYTCEHHLRYCQQDEALTFFSTIRNDGEEKFSPHLQSHCQTN
jgi:hypothetical protein